MRNGLFSTVLVMTILSSCVIRKPIVVEQSKNNKDYDIAYLFEHDGCKVYRFQDMGHYVYFTNCHNEVNYNSDSTNIIKTIDKRRTKK